MIEKDYLVELFIEEDSGELFKYEYRCFEN